jgi:trehalose/maltose hydrolase-like predicted phosphorylase
MRKFFATLFVLMLIILLSSRSFAQDTESGWLIKADHINPANYYGVTLGNGMIGLVSSANPMSVKDVVLNGAYDNYGRGRTSNILKGFSFANMSLVVDGQYISIDNVTDYHQTMDMKHAVLIEQFDVGDKATVTYKLRALRELPFTSLIQMTVTAHKNISITPSNSIEAPSILKDVHNYYSQITHSHGEIPLMTSVAKSPTGKLTVAASCSYIFEGMKQPHMIHQEWDQNRHLIQFTKELKKGQTITFSVVGSEASSAQFSDPRNEAERLSIFASLEGTNRLIQRHNEAWAHLWNGDIKITGNIQDQRDVRFSLYNLYSFIRSGTDYSLSPMGLSGLGYNGHVFWDAEIWMYPSMLLLHPDIAKSMLDYRYKRLGAAKENALSLGYKGAMFPWESDNTGQEATPVWALSGPFEHHITADIGIAFWNYYLVTRNKKYLKEKGYPVLKAVANFWVSRVQKDKNGHDNINNVVAADEWAENINNDAFTNGAAITALNDAVKAARILGEKPDPKWSNAAGLIPINHFKNGVVKEFDSYHGEPIKQADVNLLAYPLHIVNDKTTIQKDLEYYEPKIGNGPAMSYSVLSTLFSRLGNKDKSYQLFEKGFVPNKKPPFGVLAESAGGTNPYFATGAGGMLQAVLAGFGGLHITKQGIIQKNGLLPKEWKSLTITGVGVNNETFTVK